MTTSSQSTLTLQPSWQRLSPIAIVYFLFDVIKSLSQSFIYLIPGGVVGHRYISGHENEFLIGAIGFIVLVCARCFASYWFYQYRISQDTFEVSAGLFKKRYLNLPFERIQNIKLEQPLIYRFTGHVAVTLDSAGSKDEEAKIYALTQQDANALREAILLARKADQPDSQATLVNATPSPANQGAEQDEQLLNTRSILDLIIHGVANNHLWLLLGALLSAQDVLLLWVEGLLSDLGINIDDVIAHATGSWWQISAAALMLFLLLLIPLSLLSILGSIIVFYNYRLSRLSDRYIRRCGLFTRQEVSVRLSRIQMIESKQDWLDRLIGRTNLVFQQNLSGSEVRSVETVSNLVVPSVKAHERDALIAETWPDAQPFTKVQYRSASPCYFLYFLTLFVLPLSIVTSTALWVYLDVGYALAGVSVLIIIALLFFCHWRRLGFAADDHYYYVRSGILGVRYVCFPIYKLQQVSIEQSLVMTKHKLASVKFVLASGAILVPYIDESLAYDIANQALYKTESLKKSWM